MERRLLSYIDHALSAILDYFRRVTFKISSGRGAAGANSLLGTVRPQVRVHRLSIRMLLLQSTLCMLLLSGCGSLGPKLAPANLQEPGWKLREGQAVWRLPKTDRDIAGEVLVATRPDGRAFVQFTKSPFPLVVAQSTPAGWEAEFPSQKKRYSGRGRPPQRLIWLYLPRVLAGQQPPENWTWHQDNSGWSLINHANGEGLEGYFNQ